MATMFLAGSAQGLHMSERLSSVQVTVVPLNYIMGKKHLHSQT